MKHIFFLCLCGALAVGCKKSTQNEPAPAKPAVSTVAASATPSVSGSAPVVANASAAPSAAAVASQIPTEEDFELSAETAITAANLKAEVDKLAAEVGK